MREQIDGVVHRLAHQCSPESDRDAVHGTMDQTHGGNTGQNPARHRNQCQRQHAHRSINEQQHCSDQQRAEHGKAHGVMLDAGTTFNRKHARPGHDQTRTGNLQLHHDFVEGSTNPRQGLLLRIDVEAGRAGLRDQQRARTVGRKPDAIAFIRPALPLQAIDQLQHFAGWVARQQMTR